jgi:hypothetical protein
MVEKLWFLNIHIFKTTTDGGMVLFLFERYVFPLGPYLYFSFFDFVINNNKINCNLRTMQEAVTLKPISKLTKKKVWGPWKLNFKAFGAITGLPKKSPILL